MAEPSFALELPIGDVARMLGIPSPTVNTWRKRGLLPDIGEYQGEKKARLYGIGEMIVLAITHELTSEIPPISAAAAASIAIMCIGEFKAYKGKIPAGALFVLQPGINVIHQSRIFTAEELPSQLKKWSTSHHRTRLELIDLRQVALRVAAKLARCQDKRLRDEHSEKEVMELIEPFFQDRIAEYLEGEREKQDKAAAERMKLYA